MSSDDDDLERGLAFRLHGGGLPEQEDMSNAHQSPWASMFRIHTAVAGFRCLANTIGTPKDNLQLRQRLHNTRLQIGQLVKETSAKLKQVADNQDQNHPQVPVLKTFFQLQPVEEIANAKLAKDLQSVLREFQKAHLLAAERDTACASFPPEDTLSSRNAALRSPNNVEQTDFIESKRQEVILLENVSDLHESIIEERELGIKEIQQQINEVNEIFRDLADLIHEQETTIEGITSNTEMSNTAITEATSELANASRNHSSQSSTTCLLLVIFGVILLIVVILLAAR